jgi:DNA-binding HxlR family transcriptional regulator
MDQSCTVYKTLDFVSKRWTLLIMLELYKSAGKGKRYSDLRKKIPKITPKMLSARLKELERRKIVYRNVDTQSFPIKWEYGLTQSGKDFMSVVDEIKRWGLRNGIENTHCAKTSCQACMH